MEPLDRTLCWGGPSPQSHTIQLFSDLDLSENDDIRKTFQLSSKEFSPKYVLKIGNLAFRRFSQ